MFKIEHIISLMKKRIVDISVMEKYLEKQETLL